MRNLPLWLVADVEALRAISASIGMLMPYLNDDWKRNVKNIPKALRDIADRIEGGDDETDK